MASKRKLADTAKGLNKRQDAWSDLTPSDRAERPSYPPHSYRRRSFRSFADATEPHHPITGDYVALTDDAPLAAPADSENGEGGADGAMDGCLRRTSLTRHSLPSGSEADDEGSTLLRGLLPLPLPQRKELRGTQGVDQDSPVVTPGFLNGAGRSLSVEFRRQRGIRVDQKANLREESQERKDRSRKRRRGELLRHVIETVLVALTGGLLLCREDVWHQAFDMYRGMDSPNLTTEWEVQRELIDVFAAEIITHFSIFSLVLLFYALRLLYDSRSLPSTARFHPAKLLWISSSFDPAPFLYPVFLPIYVTLSLQTACTRLVVSNLILSLSSLPFLSAFPGDRQTYFNVSHWGLASLPLAAGQVASRSRPYSTLSLSTPTSVRSTAFEYALWLYPLHQALLFVLRDITSTSLLPAEIQLLAIGLINLLVHSISPQAVILKTLLWGGGITILVFCGPVLRWGVALARIPKWRFRRAAKVIKTRDVFFALLGGPKDTVNTRDSDADEDGPPGLSTRAWRPGLTSGRDHLRGAISHQATDAPTQPALDPRAGLGRKSVDGGPKVNISNGRNQTQMASVGDGFHGRGPSPGESGSGRGQRGSSLFYVRSYLALTPSQAAFRKWLYAAYVYAMILLSVMLGIRTHIGRYALNGSEPFGWALGYLAGDIHWLRFYRAKWSLESWICLPQLAEERSTPPNDFKSLDHIRSDFFGPANTRLLLSGYFLTIVVVGIGVVLYLKDSVEVDTRRKVFHGMMVAMFLPSTFIDPIFAGFSMALVLAGFLLLEVFRASQLPPVSKPLAHFLTPYVDGRDLRGPVVVSHIFLLVGCAVPLWLSLARLERTGEGCWAGWDVGLREVGMVSGVICVGMGDAAASLIGRRFGRHKWPWSGGKSLEGSLAFALAVISGLCLARLWLWAGGWRGDSGDSWGETLLRCTIAGGTASLTEAVLTGGNDNVIVPVVLWLLVRGLRV